MRLRWRLVRNCIMSNRRIWWAAFDRRRAPVSNRKQREEFSCRVVSHGWVVVKCCLHLALLSLVRTCGWCRNCMRDERVGLPARKRTVIFKPAQGAGASPSVCVPKVGRWVYKRDAVYYGRTLHKTGAISCRTDHTLEHLPSWQTLSQCRWGVSFWLAAGSAVRTSGR